MRKKRKDERRSSPNRSCCEMDTCINSCKDRWSGAYHKPWMPSKQLLHIGSVKKNWHLFAALILLIIFMEIWLQNAIFTSTLNVVIPYVVIKALLAGIESILAICPVGQDAN